MKDPMMIQHQAYLNDLESAAKASLPTWERALTKPSPFASGRGKMLFVAFLAIVVPLPWDAITS